MAATGTIPHRPAQDGDEAHRRNVSDAARDLLYEHIQEEMEARASLAGLPDPGVGRGQRKSRSRVSSMGGSFASSPSVSSSAASALMTRLERVLAEHDVDNRAEGQNQDMQGKEMMALVAVVMFPSVALCTTMLALLYI